MCALKTTQALHHRVPVKDEPPKPITIPHGLLPTLSLLRDHITELTRDNEALRYTFIGRGPAAATSSKVTLEDMEAEGAISAHLSGGIQGVDLEAVVGRVKELLKENDELGDMVLEAGRWGEVKWEKTLEGAFKVEI